MWANLNLVPSVLWFSTNTVRLEQDLHIHVLIRYNWIFLSLHSHKHSLFFLSICPPLLLFSPLLTLRNPPLPPHRSSSLPLSSPLQLSTSSPICNGNAMFSVQLISISRAAPSPALLPWVFNCISISTALCVCVCWCVWQPYVCVLVCVWLMESD